MKKLLLVVTLVVLAVPATAPAKGSGAAHKSAAKQCKALRAQMGADVFRAVFGTKRGRNALGRCVSTQRKARRDARKRARKACRAKGVRGQAMKRCMRAALAADPAPDPAAYAEAADECRADQAEDPEGFAAEFGEGDAALAMCVADELADGDESDEPGDEGDEPDDLDEAPGAESDLDEL